MRVGYDLFHEACLQKKHLFTALIKGLCEAVHGNRWIPSKKQKDAHAGDRTQDLLCVREMSYH
jgi:hypothetical protein